MTKKPNLVLFFVDDLGIGDVSIFNEEAKFKTPNIDRLAEKGLRFTDSHATSALCTPSRYGLLTGRYNWRSRLKSSVLPGDSEALIEKGRRTIAQLLKDHDYNTAAIGKWHLGMDWVLKDEKDYETYGIDRELAESREPQIQAGRDGNFGNTTGFSYVIGTDIDYSKPIKFGPLNYGFDYFYGTAASLDQGPFIVIENDRVIEEPVQIYGNSGISRLSDTTPKVSELGVIGYEHSPYHIPDQMQAKALEVLDDFIEKDQPFFLYYPNHLVHGPIIPQERFKGKSGIGDYGDFVLQLDSYVGEVIDKLEEADEFNDTIFVFTSDNGVSAVAGLKDLQSKGHYSSMHYRGEKFFIWEGGHREPTIVSYPRMIEGGQVSNHMVSHSDLYATMAELLGEELSDDTAEDSYSNLSLWQGKNKPVRQDIIHSAGNGGFSIRRDFWKLILVTGGGGDFSYQADRTKESFEKVFKATELYDLRDDVSETTNIINQHPDVVEELSQALADYIKSGRSTEGESQANEPDCPTGDWEQLAWMDDYEEYVKGLNKTID